MKRIRRQIALQNKRPRKERYLTKARRSALCAAKVLKEINTDFPWEGETLRTVYLQDAEDLLYEAIRLIRKVRRGVR